MGVAIEVLVKVDVDVTMAAVDNSQLSIVKVKTRQLRLPLADGRSCLSMGTGVQGRGDEARVWGKEFMTEAAMGVDGSSDLATSAGPQRQPHKRSMALVRLALGRICGGRVVLLNRPSAGRYAAHLVSACLGCSIRTISCGSGCGCRAKT